MRARGLKLILFTSYFKGLRSRPMRARGLKLTVGSLEDYFGLVAPHAGAWIETIPFTVSFQEMKSRAPCGRVD